MRKLNKFLGILFGATGGCLALLFGAVILLAAIVMLCICGPFLFVGACFLDKAI